MITRELTARLEVDAARRIPYAVYLPARYADEMRRWPLVVYLHRALDGKDSLFAATQQGLPALLERSEDQPFVCLTPKCPLGKFWHECLPDLMAVVEHVIQNYRIDTSRVAVTGLGRMAASGVFSLAAAKPDMFARIVMRDGWAPDAQVAELTNAKVLVHNNLAYPFISAEEITEFHGLLEQRASQAATSVSTDPAPQDHVQAEMDFYSTDRLAWLLDGEAVELRSGPRRAHRITSELVLDAGRTEQREYRALVYCPAQIDAESTEASVPLVLYLHGMSEHGEDLQLVRQYGLPKLIETGEINPDFVVLAPQCPSDKGWSGNKAMLLHFLQLVLDSYPIDRQRVYLSGFSGGGYAAWEVLRDHPGRFAAAVTVSAGCYLDVEELPQVPVLAFHGQRDALVPVAASQSAVHNARRAGLEAELVIYPDRGHGAWKEAYKSPQFERWFQRRLR